MLRLGFWVLAALACVLVGAELDAAPESARALWERGAPASLAYARDLAARHLHREVWHDGVERALGLRPSALAALAALAL